MPTEVLNAVVPRKLLSLEIMVASARSDVPDDLLHAAQVEVYRHTDPETGVESQKIRVWYDEEAKRIPMAMIAPGLAKPQPAKRRWWAPWRRAA